MGERTLGLSVGPRLLVEEGLAWIDPLEALEKFRGSRNAVLLLSGSGAQDRDSTLFGHRSFLLIADHLTRAGIAVLRVDDRGVGGSNGDLAQSTLSDFAEDVLLLTVAQ